MTLDQENQAMARSDDCADCGQGFARHVLAHADAAPPALRGKGLYRDPETQFSWPDLYCPQPPLAGASASDLGYAAWVLLANGAYWDHTDPKRAAEWKAATDRWRDRWHAEGERARVAPSPAEEPEVQRFTAIEERMAEIKAPWLSVNLDVNEYLAGHNEVELFDLLGKLKDLLG
jgi:hypothetical protein